MSEEKQITQKINDEPPKRRRRRKPRYARTENVPNLNVESVTKAMDSMHIHPETNGSKEKTAASRRRRRKPKKIENVVFSEENGTPNSSPAGAMTKGGDSPTYEPSKSKAKKKKSRKNKRKSKQNEEEKEKKPKGNKNVEQVTEYFAEKSHLAIVKEMCRHLLPDEEPPLTISQGRAMLDPIHINIFDYVAGLYHLVYDNIDDLKDRCEELRALPRNSPVLGAGVGYYPIDAAKEEGLRDLLRSLFYGRRRRD